MSLLALLGLAEDTLAAPGPRPPVPVASNDGQAEALALFRESLIAYRAGKFRESAELLERAYALRPKPVLLYNLARAFEGMGELGRACTAYAGYLDGDPAAPDALAIQARIETLRQLIDERARLDRERRAAVDRAEMEAERNRAADRNQKYSPAPWAIAGVGVAGLLSGVALGGVARSQNDSASSAASQADGQAQIDHAHRLALGANIALGVGAALSLAGGIWGVIDLLHVRGARARGRSVRATSGGYRP